ncbi:aldolase [Imleria badia]|nr:aldolase [Imleria badia]
MSLDTTSTPGYTFAASGAVAASLIATAEALVNPHGKGIYATDDTIKGIESRMLRWRECLYESLPTDYISGVILYHETLIDFQLAAVLIDRGIIPGVRADADAHPLPISPLEPATQGLDNLLPRLQVAYKAGARFSKWRAPILCNSSTLPTQAGLAPDVDFAEDADLKKSVEVYVKITSLVYARCAAYGVLLEGRLITCMLGSLIKPSFPQPGYKHPSRSMTSVETIGLAKATILARSMPVSAAGVVFLSGGLSDSDAVKYLSAVNAVANKAPVGSPLSRLPNLTFSFGRGLQGQATSKWVRGDETGAKQAFEERLAGWLQR